MASWRCPHCDAPQPETTRCWVCHRSTISCATCRHFRRAVALKVGYCALDRSRAPLTGDEERACWERSPAGARWLHPEHEPLADAAGFGGGGIWSSADDLGAAPEDREADPAGNSATPGSSTPGSIAAEGEALGPAAAHMWIDADLVRDPEPDREPDAGTVGSRPWGPVPGHRDGAGGPRRTRWPPQG